MDTFFHVHSAIAILSLCFSPSSLHSRSDSSLCRHSSLPALTLCQSIVAIINRIIALEDLLLVLGRLMVSCTWVPWPMLMVFWLLEYCRVGSGRSWPCNLQPDRLLCQPSNIRFDCSVTRLVGCSCYHWCIAYGSRWSRLPVHGSPWLLLPHDLVLVSLLTCKSCLAAAWWFLLAMWVPVGTPLVFFTVLSVASDPCFAVTFVLNHAEWVVMLLLCVSLWDWC